MLPLLAVVLLQSPAWGGTALPSVEGPDIPPVTAPTVVTVFDEEHFDGCAGKVAATRTIAVPAAGWNRVVLELTARPDGDPWDRLFSVSFGPVEVLRGTTPRTTFTVRKDVTEYASLLPPGGTAPVTLELGTYVGAQKGTVKIEFYYGEPTAALVRPPADEITGIFRTRSLTGNGTRLTAPVTFPETPPQRAIVDLTLSNHGREEARFQQRAFHVLVDGREIAVAPAMPYVYAILGFGASNANQACTGPATSAVGDVVHPAAWWTAQRAADIAGVHLGVGEIPPYRAEVAAEDLPLLAGARTVEVVQERGVEYWVTSLSVLFDRL